MKRWKLTAVLLVLCVAFIGCAAEKAEAFDKEKIVITAEVSTEKVSAVDTVDLLDVAIGSSLAVDVDLVVTNLEVQTALMTFGYEFSPFITPYGIAGVANIQLENDLRGVLTVGSSSHGGDILKTGYESTDFAFGAGARGDLAEYKGIVFSYDGRVLYTKGKDNNGIRVIPAHTDIVIDNEIEVEYLRTQLALMAGREFLLRDAEGNKRIIDSATPYIGYRIAKTDLNIKNGNVDECIKIANETNYEGVSHDGLAGVGIKINNHWEVNLAAVIGQSQGGGASATYRF